MSAAPVSDPHAVDVPRYPARFREGEERSRRIGRPLARIAGISAPDAGVMDRLGRAYFEKDETGARLARAMRLRAGTPGRVSRRRLDEALRGEPGSLDDTPEILRSYVDGLARTPEWVDWDRIERGRLAYLRLGQNAADVLLQLSLIGGYRFGGPTDLLVATGGLTGSTTLRRLAETQHWTMSLSLPDGLRPFGEAWRLTAHVRAMHAVVNESMEPRWDIERWGLPINQADLAATLGLFDATVLIGVRTLGVPISSEESRDIMHMWRYVGWLMGVDDDFLVDGERERHRLNYHVLLAQASLSEAGPKLARALVEADSGRLRTGRFRVIDGLRRCFERERLLSMLTVFLGPQSMRELGLPGRPPWAHAYLIVLNTWRYRTPLGRRRLYSWALAVRSRQRKETFGDADADIGRPAV